MADKENMFRIKDGVLKGFKYDYIGKFSVSAYLDFLASITDTEEIPESVIKIGKWAFARCSNLTKIKIPESVVEIEEKAFEFCENLKEITIPESVTEIGKGAFIACPNLEIHLTDSENGRKLAEQLKVSAEHEFDGKKIYVGDEVYFEREEAERTEEAPAEEIVDGHEAEEIEEEEERDVDPVDPVTPFAPPTYTRLSPDHQKNIKIVGADNKKIKEIKQNIALIKDNDDASVKTLMNFKAPVDGVSKDIITVLNSEDEYWVEIRLPDAFVSEKGAALAADPNIKIEGGIIKLKIDPSKTANPINIKNGDKGKSTKDPESADDQLIVTITSEDGVKYEIAVDSTSVDMKIGDKEYAYSITKEDDQCIDAEVNLIAVEKMLSDSDKVFATAKNVTEIPKYLLGMYYQTLEDNTTKNFGRFSVIKASFEADKDFCMLCDENDKTMYLFNDGKMLQIDGFSFQYEKKGGKIVPYIVLTGTKGPSYYRFAMGELKTNKAGEVKLNGKSKVESSNPALFKFLKGFEKQYVNLEASVETEKFVVGDREFTLADGREYEAYKFDVKSKTQTHQLRELPEKVAEDERRTGYEVDGDGSDGDSGDDKPDKTDDKKEKSTEDEKSKKSDDENKNKDTIEKKIIKPPFDKKAIEAFGNSMGIIGLLLMLGALIPGVGIFFAILGGALAATGIGGVLLAEKLAFSPYEVEKRHLGEYVDYQAVEFLENEDELESLISKSNEAANEVDRISNLSPIEGGNELANNFMMVYNKNGLAFNQDGDFNARDKFLIDYDSEFDRISALDESARDAEIEKFITNNYGDVDDERKTTLTTLFKNGNKNELLKQANLPLQTRYQRLLSRDGLTERETIIDEINEINNPVNASKREKLIDDFIFVHFDESTLEADNREKIKAMFTDTSKEKLVEYVDKMKTLNEAQREETAKLDAQKSALGHKTNDQIGRIFGYSKLSPERRKTLIERYGITALKHLALDDLTHEKVSEVLENIPEDERAELFEILTTQASNMQSDAEKIKDISAEQRDINDLDTYGKVLAAVTQDGYTSDKTITEATAEFNRNYTAECLGRTEAARRAEWLRDEEEFVTGSTPLKNIQNIIGNAVTEMITHDQEELIEQFKVLEDKATELGFASDLGDMNYNSFIDDSATNPQARTGNPRQIGEAHPGGLYEIGKTHYWLLHEMVDREIESLDSQYTFATGFTSVTKEDGSPVENADELLQRRKTLQEAKKAYSFITGNRYNFHESKKVPGKTTKSELITKVANAILETAGLRKSDFTSTSGKYNIAYTIALDELKDAGEFDEEQKKSIAMITAFARVKDLEDETLERATIDNDGIDSATKSDMLQMLNEEREVCTRMFEFVTLLRGNCRLTSNINCAIRSAAYKRYCESTHHMDLTNPRGLDESAQQLDAICQVKVNQEQLIDGFSKDRQKRIREARGENLTFEAFASDLKEAIGDDKIVGSTHTFQYYADESKLSEKSTEAQARYEEFAKHIANLNDLNERRATIKLSSFASEYGHNFVETQYKYYVENEKEQSDTNYNDIIDYLVKRFGIDRYKLIDEIGKIRKNNESINNSDLVNSLCKKFGISIDAAEIKKLDEYVQRKLYRAENDPNVKLTHLEEERIELIVKDLELQEFEIYLKKFDKYVKAHDYAKVLELCKDDKFKDLLKTMSNDFADVYTLQNIKKDMLSLEAIKTLLENDDFATKTDEEKQSMFDNLLKTTNSVSEGGRISELLKSDLDKKIDVNQKKLTEVAISSTFKGISDREVNEAREEFKKIDESLKMLNTVYSKLKNLQTSKGYMPDQIDILLDEFAHGHFDNIVTEFPELTGILNTSTETVVRKLFSHRRGNIRKAFDNVLKDQRGAWDKAKEALDKALESALKELSPKDREVLEREAVGSAGTSNNLYATMLSNVGDIEHIIGTLASQEKARAAHKTQTQIVVETLEAEYPDADKDKTKDDEEHA